LPEQLEAAILVAKPEKPNWGARKIRERLLRRLPHEVKIPARSTIYARDLSKCFDYGLGLHYLLSD
jgi:hypothetical protein